MHDKRDTKKTTATEKDSKGKGVCPVLEPALPTPSRLSYSEAQWLLGLDMFTFPTRGARL